MINSLSHVLFRPHLENHIHPGPPGKDKDGEKEKKKIRKSVQGPGDVQKRSEDFHGNGGEEQISLD